jgi:hypothetical protein
MATGFWQGRDVISWKINTEVLGGERDLLEGLPSEKHHIGCTAAGDLCCRLAVHPAVGLHEIINREY